MRQPGRERRRRKILGCKGAGQAGAFQRCTATGKTPSKREEPHQGQKRWYVAKHAGLQLAVTG